MQICLCWLYVVAFATHNTINLLRHGDLPTPVPIVGGHEGSGVVEEVGPGVDGFEKGDAYLVYGPVGCGRCKACSRGQDTYCENQATNPYMGIGLGRDGGMAEYVTVPARNLVPLGDADPVAAAPLADAGLTPYHAIKLALPHLAGGGRSRSRCAHVCVGCIQPLRTWMKKTRRSGEWRGLMDTYSTDRRKTESDPRTQRQ